LILSELGYTVGFLRVISPIFTQTYKLKSAETMKKEKRITLKKRKKDKIYKLTQFKDSRK